MILNYKKLVPFLFVVSWLPALVFAWLLVFVPVVSVRLYPLAVSIIGWVLAGLMLLVWGVLVVVLAYHFRTATLGGILIYFGLNALLVSIGYLGLYPSGSRAAWFFAGAFSYSPLYPFMNLLAKLPDIPYEAVFVLALSTVFLVCWLIGLILYQRSLRYFG